MSKCKVVRNLPISEENDLTFELERCYDIVKGIDDVNSYRYNEWAQGALLDKLEESIVTAYRLAGGDASKLFGYHESNGAETEGGAE